MPCTTILVGKNASYDGSTIMARDDDSGAGYFDEKKQIVVTPDEQPREYQSVISKCKITLPDNPLRYTSMPNIDMKIGIWAEAGVNSENVAMSATETITSNPRVLGADPLVKEGIGEEDFITIVLPYIHSAKEGVVRLGSLLEQYGTYEMNGIGFQDVDEIWWLETIGGHHWIAKKVPDDCYVVGPNQLGIDCFDFTDAFSDCNENMCSSDLIEFIEENHLNRMMDCHSLKLEECFDVRAAFGSASDSDHCYNTPRGWYMLRYFNPNDFIWDGPYADFTPESNDLPWCLVPEKKITIEDVKYVLSSYYQGTPYNPYAKHGDTSKAGMYRPIGINRNSCLAITQIRPYLPKEISSVEWLAFGSNAFNGVVPVYSNVDTIPEYLANTAKDVSTDNFYWTNRLIAALTDAHYSENIAHIERYQNKMASTGHHLIGEFDKKYLQQKPQDVVSFLQQANQQICDIAQKQTQDVLNKVLHTSSLLMKNSFSRSDG